jgi:hypothetical protein
MSDRSALLRMEVATLRAQLAEAQRLAKMEADVYRKNVEALATLRALLAAHRTLAAQAVAEAWPFHQYAIAARKLDRDNEKPPPASASPGTPRGE